MCANQNKIVSLGQGLFTISPLGDRVSLIGSKCRDCSEYFYPKRYVCLNCYGQSLEEVSLSARGKVWTYTVAWMAPPGSVVKTPYVVAQIELPEGVMIPAVVEGCEPETVKIGMEVEIAIKKVGKDEQGNEVAAFVFKPTTTK